MILVVFIILSLYQQKSKKRINKQSYLSTEGDPDLLHLLGADIVSTDDEALGVLVQQLGQLSEVVGFPGRLVLPNHLVI